MRVGDTSVLDAALDSEVIGDHFRLSTTAFSFGTTLQASISEWLAIPRDCRQGRD